MNSERAFYGVASLLFIASAAATIAACASMSSMSGMEMPGGWTMSMMWMRMPDQTWSGAAASFLGMWIVMMVAMMLPSLLPMLRRYRNVVRISAPTRLARSTLLAALGYFLVWSALGLAAYLLGVVLAAIAMDVPVLSHRAPAAIGISVIIVGTLQFTHWKARWLACCRGELRCCETPPVGTGDALRHGLELGIQCARCCGGMMIVLLLVGVMNMLAMAVVTAAITLERVTARGERMARLIGAVTVMAGIVLLVRAA